MSLSRDRPMIYDLQVTLTCPLCGADCYLGDPYAKYSFGMVSVSEQVLEAFLTASMNHRKEGCKKPQRTFFPLRAAP